MKIKYFFLIIFAYFFLFNNFAFAEFTNEAKENYLKSISPNTEECTLYSKLTSDRNYQEINCTSEKTYPLPTLGYDKNHCVILKPRIVIGKKIKTKKNKNGLICSMNGYSNYAYWYYVK